MNPACDCPTCPRCGSSTGLSVDHNDNELPPPRLQCAACGHQWTGTLDERAQADRAQAAWERQRDGV